MYFFEFFLLMEWMFTSLAVADGPMFADKCRTTRVLTCTWPPRPSTRRGPGCGPTPTPSSPSTRQSSSSCSRPAPSQATPAVSEWYSPYILTSILHRSTGDYKDLCLPNEWWRLCEQETWWKLVYSDLSEYLLDWCSINVKIEKR